MSGRYLALVEALRTNDALAIDSQINYLSILTDKSIVQQLTYGSPLHLSISLSNKSTVDRILTQYVSRSNPEWIYQQNDELETPLHLAAKLGRLDVVVDLFRQTLVNETILNSMNLRCEDVSKNEKIAHVFTCTSYIHLNECLAEKRAFRDYLLASIKACLLSKNTAEIIALFAKSERSTGYLKLRWFDINSSIDSDTDECVLFYAARWEDLTLMDWALANGADTSVKNRKGKRPFEKGSVTRSKLKPVAHQAALLSSALILSTPVVQDNFPFHDGMLLKWINYAEGYKSRYFVVEDGTLSYYKSKVDYPHSCRGGISMIIASINLPDSEDQSRFDIVGKGSVRYCLKARTPAEAKQWIWTLIACKKYGEDNVAIAEEVEDWGSVANFSDDEAAITPVRIHSIDMNTHDSDSVLELLKLQLDIQSKAVAEIQSEIIQSNSDGASLRGLADTLAQSSHSILSISIGIKESLLKRDADWQKKYKQQADSARRWEEIVVKIVGLSTDKPLDTPDRSAESDDEFYDAQSEEKEEFLEKLFGFESFTEGPLDQSARSMSLSNQRALQKQSLFIEVNDAFNMLSHAYPETPRVKLPFDSTQLKPTLNVFSFLKSAIGKDLSKVTLPVYFNEPISMLQRFAEDTEYIELLSFASMCGNLSKSNDHIGLKLKQHLDSLTITPVILSKLDAPFAQELRHLSIAAFAISNYSSTIDRTGKPFNPMLGETFELVNADKGFRYVSEQVCHHPPVSASHCSSPDYIFWAELSKFWGKCLEIQPQGTCHVKLNVLGGEEHYAWKKVTTTVNNIIAGKMWVDNHGDMKITNYSSGCDCILTFKSQAKGWFGTQTASTTIGEISGTLNDANGDVVWRVYGSWSRELYAERIDKSGLPIWMQGAVKLWSYTPPPTISAEQFKFTEMAMGLNEMSDSMQEVLPMSDSRRRGDQRAMEKGLWSEADRLKEKIEMKQRTDRTISVQNYEATGAINGPAEAGIAMGEQWWNPRWFTREVDVDSGEDTWVFTNAYWHHRKSNTLVPDLFTV